jgi:hypothetical protein
MKENLSQLLEVKELKLEISKDSLIISREIMNKLKEHLTMRKRELSMIMKTN